MTILLGHEKLKPSSSYIHFHFVRGVSFVEDNRKYWYIGEAYAIIVSDVVTRVM